MSSTNAEDDELYGDLPKATIFRTKASATLPNCQNDISVQNIEELEKAVVVLKAENQKLRRNIGTLFRTAKTEIQRKNDEIARLLRRLESVEKSQM